MNLIPIMDDKDGFDLLAWWKPYEIKFLMLSTIACDILTILASTIALEKAFSAGGRLIELRRTMLLEKIVEPYMCLQN